MKRVYEVLLEKADRCRLAAMRTEGEVSLMWLNKAIELTNKTKTMSIGEALTIVEE